MSPAPKGATAQKKAKLSFVKISADQSQGNPAEVPALTDENPKNLYEKAAA